MRRIIFAAVTFVSLVAAPALAAYPICSSTSSGLCQASPTDGTVLYGCGDGNFVGSGCSTCDDACFACSSWGQGCASLEPDEPNEVEAAPARFEMMACMPTDDAPRG